ERQSPQSDNRCTLREHKWPRQRVAECIPWKARQHVTAEPLGRRECYGKRENTHGAARPNCARKREPQRSKCCQPSWQRDHGKWQKPSKRLGIDQKCITDP